MYVFKKLLKFNEEFENKKTTYKRHIKPLDLSKIVEILAKQKFNIEYTIHNYIATCIEKYDKLDKLDKDKREEYKRYIQQTLNKCLIPIFNNIDGYYNVNKSWQITSKNKDNMMPFFVLNAFIKWAENFRGKTIKDTELLNHGEQLGNVVNALFPTIDIDTFSNFLKLCFNDKKGIPDITEAVEDKNYNIFFTNGYTGTGRSIDERMKAMDEREKNKKSELINIIFYYFYNWGILQINGIDMTENERKNWDNLTPQDEQNIQVRKMGKFKQAFEKYAKDKNEPNKVIPFINLIDLLIERLEKPIDE